MKMGFTDNGTLIIIPDDTVEDYALKQWAERAFNPETGTLDGGMLIIRHYQEDDDYEWQET